VGQTELLERLSLSENKAISRNVSLLTAEDIFFLFLQPLPKIHTSYQYLGDWKNMTVKKYF
jgi:hypothetical protein